MKIKNLKNNIILFIIVAVMIFFSVKFTGGFRNSIIEPISFEETLDKMPLILIISFLIVFTKNFSDHKK
jgi:hypothetical protein